MSTDDPTGPTARAAALGLTHRQGEVLTMLLQGLPNKRIARALNVTEGTVKEHVSGILLRLGVANRVEVILRLHGQAIGAQPGPVGRPPPHHGRVPAGRPSS